MLSTTTKTKYMPNSELTILEKVFLSFKSSLCLISTTTILKTKKKGYDELIYD